MAAPACTLGFEAVSLIPCHNPRPASLVVSLGDLDVSRETISLSVIPAYIPVSAPADLDASLQGERRYSGDFVGQGAEQIGPDGDTDVFATNVFYLSDISRTLPAVGINAPDHYAARTIPFPALHAEELPSVAATA